MAFHSFTACYKCFLIFNENIGASREAEALVLVRNRFVGFTNHISSDGKVINEEKKS
jgi:hypothetical protein